MFVVSSPGSGAREKTSGGQAELKHVVMKGAREPAFGEVMVLLEAVRSS